MPTRKRLVTTLSNSVTEVCIVWYGSVPLGRTPSLQAAILIVRAHMLDKGVTMATDGAYRIETRRTQSVDAHTESVDDERTV